MAMKFKYQMKQKESLAIEPLQRTYSTTFWSIRLETLGMELLHRVA